MAFKADCGASTVLEAPGVASTPMFPGPATSRSPCNESLRNSATPTGDSEGAAGGLVAQASRLHVRPGRPHHKTHRIDLSLRFRRLVYWAPNSKFEISPVDCPSFLIPNSKFLIRSPTPIPRDRFKRRLVGLSACWTK